MCVLRAPRQWRTAWGGRKPPFPPSQGTSQESSPATAVPLNWVFSGEPERPSPNACGAEWPSRLPWDAPRLGQHRERSWGLWSPSVGRLLGAKEAFPCFLRAGRTSSTTGSEIPPGAILLRSGCCSAGGWSPGGFNKGFHKFMGENELWLLKAKIQLLAQLRALLLTPFLGHATASARPGRRAGQP